MSSQVSRDTLFNGALYCLQHIDGYRFSIDAPLLADFAAPPNGGRVLDLGAGCGVISLILAYRRPDLRLTALELQDSLLELISENIAINNLSARVEALRGDFRAIGEVMAGESCDYAVCNPPYYSPGSGRKNPNSEAAIARHASENTLDDAARAVFFTLKNRGRAAFIYPASRGASLLATLRSRRLEPKKMRVVYSYPQASSAKLIMVEAIKNGGEELNIRAPFYIYQAPGADYTPEMAACYEDFAHS